MGNISRQDLAQVIFRGWAVYQHDMMYGHEPDQFSFFNFENLPNHKKEEFLAMANSVIKFLGDCMPEEKPKEKINKITMTSKQVWSMIDTFLMMNGLSHLHIQEVEIKGKYSTYEEVNTLEGTLTFSDD